MQEYFSHVLAAQDFVFGQPKFLPSNVSQLALALGDLNHISLDVLKDVLEADVFVVFGASFIKGALCEALVERQAINIHMGISPFYRGHSCNFWALNDGRPELVGATIHRLSKGLDSGDMLYHVFPRPEAVDQFVYGMLSVKAAHRALRDKIKSGEVFKAESVKQNKGLHIRYSREADVTDDVAQQYLSRIPPLKTVEAAISQRDLSAFIRPVLM